MDQFEAQLMKDAKNLTFGERVSKLRAAYGLSQSQLAKKIGASHGSIQNYEANSLPKGEYAIKLAEVFECSIDWLLTGSDPIYKDKKPESENKQKSVNTPIHHERESTPKDITRDESGIHIPQWDDPDPGKYHYVPMAEATLNAGGGSFVLSEKTTGKYYAFRTNFLSAMSSSLKNLVLMKVTGDSMEPKIEDGDTVMIDVGRRRILSGAIYAMGFDDTILLKEIEARPGGKVMIISRNRQLYPPYEMDTKDIRIIGQVIWGDRTFVK